MLTAAGRRRPRTLCDLHQRSIRTKPAEPASGGADLVPNGYQPQGDSPGLPFEPEGLNRGYRPAADEPEVTQNPLNHRGEPGGGWINSGVLDDANQCPVYDRCRNCGLIA